MLNASTVVLLDSKQCVQEGLCSLIGTKNMFPWEDSNLFFKGQRVGIGKKGVYCLSGIYASGSQANCAYPAGCGPMQKSQGDFFFLDASNYGDDSFMKNLDHLSLGLTEQNGFWVFNG